MKGQHETAMPSRKFVAGDKYEALQNGYWA
jgi:hypothetical protein